MILFRKSIVYILAALLLLVSALCAFSCSPQKRLNNLVKNNPELAKSDTTFIIKSFDVPGVKKDTSVKASVNTKGLTDILNLYKNVIDSLTRIKLNTAVLFFTCLLIVLFKRKGNG